MNEAIELNEAEQRVVVSLYDWYHFEAEQNEKVLRECGWGDFYGISFGEGAFDLDKLVAAGYLEARPHLRFDQNVYRCTQQGFKFASEWKDQHPEDDPYAPSIVSLTESIDVVEDYDEIPF